MNRWQELEQEFLCDKKKRKEKLYIINESEVNIKYIHQEGDPRKTYIFLHGTASDSTSFISSIEDLPNNSNIYLIDVPGFGKSTISNFNSNDNFQENLENLILESIDLFIKDIEEQNPINNIKLIGHSFGGFLAILYTNKYPAYINSLILIAPAGIFPALGDFGCYWAVFFKLGFPYTLICLLSFLNILNFIIKCAEFLGFPPSNRILHDLDMYKQNNILGPKLVASYITLFYRDFIPATYWNKPILDILIKLNTEKKIKLLFGRYDDIVPFHQGEFLQQLNMNVEITDCNHQLCDQKWNIATKNSNKSIIANKIKKILENDTRKTLKMPQQKIFRDPKLYACDLNITKSRDIVYKMYDDILNELEL